MVNLSYRASRGARLTVPCSFPKIDGPGGVTMSQAAFDEFVLDGKGWMVISYSPARPAALAVLTGSELEVLDRWLAGASMRAIAGDRNVTPRTVAKQLASIYEKLGVSSRAELVSLLHSLAACAPSGR